MSLRVRDLGEFTLIERLRAVLPESVRGADVVAGQEDDCAYWHVAHDSTSLVTTDALVEGVHFRLDWTDWASLGHKMLAVNLSDLASMGCVPRIVVVTLALTGDEFVADLEDLYRGAGELAATYDVVIAGGDIVRTPGPIMLSVTAFGEQSVDVPVMLRSAARPDDIVLVSGMLGASAAGMQLLQHGRTDATTAELLIGAHLRPAPRVSLGQGLVVAGVRCCMDISDGLAGDLPKILAGSGVGARIDIDRIPVLPAVRALFPDTWQRLALHGGEDYELLCTVSSEIVDHVIGIGRSLGATLTPIGVITEGESLDYHASDSSVSEHDIGAWDHFRGERNDQE